MKDEGVMFVVCGAIKLNSLYMKSRKLCIVFVRCALLTKFNFILMQCLPLHTLTYVILNAFFCVRRIIHSVIAMERPTKEYQQQRLDTKSLQLVSTKIFIIRVKI